jgi:dTDP-4-amino-4,6-dideoxygalactose transaminase
MLGDEEITEVTRVLRSGQIAQGPEVATFEDEFARYVGESKSVYAVAAANGTAALQMAMMALGIGAGDEVIVPALTFIASANAVRAAGATPVFVDVHPRYFTIDAASVEAAVTPATAAIMAVHLYGQAADMDALTETCRRHGLALIEDAAQAHGARWHGRRVGTFGVGCFSFYPTKNMTTGEGGMVTTTDAALAERLRLARNHGMRRQYEYLDFGVNLRMTDIAAAIGRVQLRRLNAWNDARRTHAAWFDVNLRGVQTPLVQPETEHVYHQYTVLSHDRDRLAQRLHEAGVGYGVYYPEPLHRTAAYAQDLDLPISEALAARVISLPMRPDLTDEERITIASAVAAAQPARR